MMLVLVASGLILTMLVLYWHRGNVWKSGRYSVWQLALLPAVLLVLILLQNDERWVVGSAAPVFVAVVADVSLSMATMPEPGEHDDVGTRMQRARRTLLNLLTELEASTRVVMIGITAFTSKAETVLGWDDDLPQVREAIEYMLTPELLTESGSDLGAALEGAARLFEILPAEYRESESGKFVVLVSDGEQNVESSDAAGAIADLKETGVKIISLHVGLPGIPEGLPIYDDQDAFVGFDPVGGQLFSLPDPETMRMLAGPDPEHGIFVKAEESGTVEAIMDFIGVNVAGSQTSSERMILMLMLWSLTTAIMFRYV